MKILLIVNDPLYIAEKAYNALRLIMALQADYSEVEMLLFLLGDSAGCALVKQSTDQGHYKIEGMPKAVIWKAPK